MQHAARVIDGVLGGLAVVVGLGAAVSFAVDPQPTREPRAIIRAHDSDRARPRSDTARKLTGPVDHLQSVVSGDVAGTMIIRLTPRTTHPAGSYNTGGCYSNDDIDGETLILEQGGPCLTYWNVELLDWQNNPTLRAWQGRLDVGDYSSGSGTPFAHPTLPCASVADCTSAYGEAGAVCSVGICRPAWRNLARADGFGQVNKGCSPAVWDIGYSAESVLFFAVQAPDEPHNGLYCALTDTGQVVYGGTLAIQIPAGAKGTYTVDWLDDTLYTGPELAPSMDPIRIPGVVRIPIGSCCFGLGNATPGCLDDVSEEHCSTLAPATFWVDGGSCLNPPTGDGCMPCLLDSDCNDNNVCTDDTCKNQGCAFIYNNAPCNDGVSCTYGDECAGGVCEGTYYSDCCGQPDGTQCNDEEFCTTADQCIGGNCMGGPSPCPGQVCDEDVNECKVPGDTDTMIIRLTPKADHPRGAYHHNGCYGQADISGQTLTIYGGGPCLTFWNVELLNWQDTPTLRAWQGRVNAAAYSTGSGASLTSPSIACTSAANCTAAFGEAGAACNAGICRPGWRNLARLDGFGQVNKGCSEATWDLTFFESDVQFYGAQDPNDPPNGIFCALNDVGQVVYGGTLAIEVPAGARGTYTIDWTFIHTFYTGPSLVGLPGNQLPGVLRIPTGSCCYDLNGAEPSCIDNLLKSECEDLPAPTHWTDGGICLAPPTDEGCGPCTVNADCEDSNTCTEEACANGRCSYFNVPEPCDDADDCTKNDHCFGGICEGDEIQCCLAPRGVSCDDSLFCTALDQCIDELCVGGQSPCSDEQWCHEAGSECERVGDYNGDDAIDLQDHAELVNCLKGVNTIVSDPCRIRLDFDENSRVDLYDVAEFMTAFSGP